MFKRQIQISSPSILQSSKKMPRASDHFEGVCWRTAPQSATVTIRWPSVTIRHLSSRLHHVRMLLQDMVAWELKRWSPEGHGRGPRLVTRCYPYRKTKNSGLHGHFHILEPAPKICEIRLWTMTCHNIIQGSSSPDPDSKGQHARQLEMPVLAMASVLSGAKI